MSDYKLKSFGENIIVKKIDKKDTVIKAEIIDSPEGFSLRSGSKILIPEYAGQIFEDYLIINKTDILCQIL